MGASSSIISRPQFNHETYEECKDEREFDSSRISYNNDNDPSSSSYSSVWLAIDAILHLCTFKTPIF
jgi:hypothetical protein